jgi:pimeloyl-ACP methyl ester carboxylesterase
MSSWRALKIFRLTVVALAVLALGSAVFTWYQARQAAWHYPPMGEFVGRPGARLHFLASRNGPPVVLLHGNPGSMRDFDPVFADLERTHQVVAIDRPGHGYSDRPTAATPRDQARLLREALAQIGIIQPVVVGHSWGGALAMIFALESPEEVSGLVLVASRAVPRADSGGALYAATRTPVMGSFLRWTVLVPLGRGLVSSGLRDAYAPDPVPPGETAAAQALWLRPSQSEATVWDTANLQEALGTYAPRFSRIRAPVTIIVGDRDALLNESGELHRLLPQSKLHVLPDTGHMVPRTRPEVIAEAVRALAPSGIGKH